MKKTPVIIFLSLAFSFAVAEVKNGPCFLDSDCALYEDQCGHLLSGLKSSVADMNAKGEQASKACLEINIIDNQRNRPKNPLTKCIQKICSVVAKPETKQSIVEYYSQIPDQFLSMKADSDGHELSKEERLSVVSVQDVKHGYISIKSEKLSSEFALALFKTKSHQVVIGIVEDGASVQQPIRFVSLQDNMWVDVTSKVFPEISKDYILKRYQAVKPNGKTYSRKELEWASHSLIRYALPREGTTINAYAGIGDDGVGKIVLFTLSFDGSKFNLKP